MIQFKRGTTDSWNNLNPVLRAGQPGYNKDENKIKIGDGTSRWTELPYIGESASARAVNLDIKDFVVESGTNGIWNYQKWNSGLARCSCRFEVKTAVQSVIDGTTLFSDSRNPNVSINYPFTFKEVPTETATVQSSQPATWLANTQMNTKDTSGGYTIISPYKQDTETVYMVSLQVEGFCK
jgi:hypothetical protein